MNTDLKARIVDRVFYVVIFAIAFIVLWVLLEIFAPAAQAAEVRVILRQDVPTVSGIEAAPSSGPWYERRPTVRVAPSADVIELPHPAPANGCLKPAFEVISGLPGERGCYGAQ